MSSMTPYGTKRERMTMIAKLDYSAQQHNGGNIINNSALRAPPSSPSASSPALLNKLWRGIVVLATFAFVVGCITLQQQRRLDASESPISAIGKQNVMNQMAGATPSVNVADGLSPLTVVAKNEYGQYDPASLFLYGLDMVVEPFRETTMSVTGGRSPVSLFHWRLAQLSAEGIPLKGVDPVIDALGGDQATVILNAPGSVFLLKVEERDIAGKAVASSAEVEVSCRYVRREIRDLTDADREEFLEALKVYYTMGTEEGRAKYGHEFFNYERITAFHSSPRNKFCYHGGLQFLTAHTAFGLMMERSLQAVNPRVSLSFWDYMVDATEYGIEWGNSPIFHDSIFGRATGSAENGYQVTDGRFGDVYAIYDPENTLVGDDFSPFHNAYGFINAAYNYQESPRLTRTNSFCNLETHSVFATPDVFFSCFENYDTLFAWELCMESKVHGDMHGLLGGSFKCNVDMKRFQNEHPEYSPGMLTFLLEDLTANYWPSNSLMPDYSVCDTECKIDQAEPCGCTCTVDPLTLSDNMVYNIMEPFLEKASERFAGSGFISYDVFSDHPWSFTQADGSRMSDKSTIYLLRHLAKIGCEPSAAGIISTGASPMDPIFWVLHPIFEKALHVLWLSPRFRHYSFDWCDGTCQGSKLGDFLPFTEASLGFGSGNDFLTNAELMALLHVTNPRLPYLYEKFDSWGTTNGWNFCEECAAAAASNADR